MATETIRYGGAVLLWRTAQFYDRQKLIDGFAAIGKPKLAPKDSTRESNLRYALDEYFAKTDVLVRPKRKGFAIIHEGRGEESQPNVYTERHSWWLDIQGEGAQQTCQLQMSPFDREVATQVAGVFNKYFGLTTGRAVTESLVALATGDCNGTTLRDQGGVYWIEQCHVPLWRQLREIIQGAAVTGRADIYLITHSLNEDSIRAVADALNDEIEADVIDMAAELEGEGEDQLGARAIAARQQQTNSLLSKVERYERLLDKPMTKLRDAVLSLNSKAALASVRLAAAKQREASAV